MCWKTRFRFLLEPSNLIRHTKRTLWFSGLWFFKCACAIPYFGYRRLFALSCLKVSTTCLRTAKVWRDCADAQAHLSLCWSPMSLLVWYYNDLLYMRLTRHQENWLYRGISVVKSHLNWLTHDLSRLFNPNKAGIPFVRFRETVQIPIRRRRLRRLIRVFRVFTVFLQDFQLQKEQKWNKIHKWQTDSPNV